MIEFQFGGFLLMCIVGFCALFPVHRENVNLRRHFVTIKHPFRLHQPSSHKHDGEEQIFRATSSVFIPYEFMIIVHRCGRLLEVAFWYSWGRVFNLLRRFLFLIQHFDVFILGACLAYKWRYRLQYFLMNCIFAKMFPFRYGMLLKNNGFVWYTWKRYKDL